MSTPKPETLERLWRRLGPPAECYLCGEPIPVEEATLDHVLPRSRGGTNQRDNQRWAHRRCNLLKGPLTVAELRDLCRKVYRHLAG